MSLILCRTPFRVSFFGGGSDYPEWFEHEAGAVLSTTVDKYIYISCRYLPPFLGIKHRVVWRHVELVDSIAELLHPAVRMGLQYLGFDDGRGLEVHYQGDLPARSGMGSSSSFVVGLIQAMKALRGIDLDKRKLAEMAIELEQKYMQEIVGSQDQIAAAYGGFNVIRFDRAGFEVKSLELPLERERELSERLVLIYPGIGRIASSIASSVTESLRDHIPTLRRMVAMVDDGVNILKGGALDDFGLLLHEAWQLKRCLSDRVSSPHIDAIYDQARVAGALGGKLLGAGGTGFMLFYAPPERKKAVIEALTPRCLHVPVGFDHVGSRIIYRADGAADYPWR